MKVPPKPPEYSKDRTLTRRTVAGAAGGMLGVHYEDTRHNDVNTIRAHTEQGTAGAGANRAVAASGEAPVSAPPLAPDADESALGMVHGKEEAEMVLDDEDAVTRDVKKRQRQRFVARDRLTIDKDAPELRRTRALWAKIMGEDDEGEEEDEGQGGPPPDLEEVDPAAIGEAIAAAGDDAPRDYAALFTRPLRSRVGDPSLTDPEAIRRALRTPIAYAKHILILGEAFKAATGARRDEVVTYMAAMYAALPSAHFARQALKEFGPATGIIDVYPLEVVETLVLRYPGVLPKVGFGRLFARPTGAEDRALELVAGLSRVLEYPKNLKIRGFALKGGEHPGYLFEPELAPGQYRLRIDTPGRYQVLISAITKNGHAIIDRVRVEVRPAGRRPKASPQPVAEPARPRDEAKIAAWPVPSVPQRDAMSLLGDEAETTQDNLLSSGEIVSRQQHDAMHGPKGASWVPDLELSGWEQDESEAQGELPPLPDDDPPLSNAEQAMLRLALATQTSQDDLVAPRDEPVTEIARPEIDVEATLEDSAAAWVRKEVAALVGVVALNAPTCVDDDGLAEETQLHPALPRETALDEAQVTLLDGDRGAVGDDETLLDAGAALDADTDVPPAPEPETWTGPVPLDDAPARPAPASNLATSGKRPPSVPGPRSTPPSSASDVRPAPATRPARDQARPPSEPGARPAPPASEPPRPSTAGRPPAPAPSAPRATSGAGAAHPAAASSAGQPAARPTSGAHPAAPAAPLVAPPAGAAGRSPAAVRATSGAGAAHPAAAPIVTPPPPLVEAPPLANAAVDVVSPPPGPSSPERSGVRRRSAELPQVTLHSPMDDFDDEPAEAAGARFVDTGARGSPLEPTDSEVPTYAEAAARPDQRKLVTEVVRAHRDGPAQRVQVDDLVLDEE